MKDIGACFLILSLLVGLNTTARASQDAKTEAADAPSAMCSLDGTVVSALTGERLKSASVTLYNTQNLFRGAHALTDERGHFVIKNVPAGSYWFRANKIGYVEQSYLPDPEHPALALVLEPGKKIARVVFRLARAGVIIGRIVDESGEPVANVEMEALVLRNRITNTHTWMAQQLASVQNVWTDDLGAYRLFDLPPGSYYVRASDSGSLGITRLPYGSGFEMATRDAQQPVYFPGVRHLRDAQKIAVRPGQEVRIDFSLHSQKTHSVSGQVRGADGEPLVTHQVTISEYDGKPGTGFSSYMTDIYTVELGNFEFKNLAPGSYLVWSAARGEDDSYLWAVQHVEVADDNVSGVQLQLRTGIDVSGKVEASEESKPDFQQIRLTLRPDGEREFMGSEDAHMEADGTFRFVGLRPGRHSLEVNGLPDGWYLRKVGFGNQNVQEDGLNLADDTNHELILAVSSGAAQVDGKVLQTGRPVPGALVRLVSNPPRSQIMAAWTDPNGHFVMKDVAPGNYQVLAAPFDDDSQDEHDDLGEVKIVLAEKESKTIEITMDKPKK